MGERWRTEEYQQGTEEGWVENKLVIWGLEALGRMGDWLFFLFGLGHTSVLGLMGFQKNSTLQAIPF